LPLEKTLLTAKKFFKKSLAFFKNTWFLAVKKKNTYKKEVTTL
jgi:hypothetical protein